MILREKCMASMYVKIFELNSGILRLCYESLEHFAHEGKRVEWRT